MTPSSFTKKYFDDISLILSQIDKSVLDKLVDLLWEIYIERKHMFFIGNGGSASLSSHLAADLGKNTISHSSTVPRFQTQSLTDNVAWITALANDLKYRDIFVEQLKNLSNPGDLLFVISGSGNSPNLVQAVKWARLNKIKTVGLLGFDGGKLKNLVKFMVLVPSLSYEYVEGVHAVIAHYLVASLKFRFNRRLSTITSNNI